MTNRAQQALLLHEGGFNCAQAVVGAFCEAYGVDQKTALRLAGGFGGGLRSGEVCGAVSGGAMVVGLKYAQTQSGDAEQKQLCYEMTEQFVAAFRARFNSITCRALLGVDIGLDKQALQNNPELKQRCNGFIAGAAELLEQLGY